MSETGSDLQRFVSAQQSNYENALDELRAGSKKSHWMWYIFPQLKGLGSSSTAQFYGIDGMGEARAYLRHEVLGSRIIACTRAVLVHDDLGTEQIFGYPDYLKFRSCMTLFDVVAETAAGAENPFHEALRIFCNGEPDDRTLDLLGSDLQGSDLQGS